MARKKSTTTKVSKTTNASKTNRKSNSTTNASKTNYKRGSLMKKMREVFYKEYQSKKHFDDLDYEEIRKIALVVKPDSKFNKYHFSWYKNHFYKEFTNKQK